MVHGPVMPLCPDALGKVAADGGCPGPFEAGRKIMDRVWTEGGGNRFGLGIVTGLDIRANHLLHVLSWSELSHRGGSSLGWSNMARCELQALVQCGLTACFPVPSPILCCTQGRDSLV